MTLAKDRALAEEITQETFFRAMTAKKSFRGESDVFTWLCAIAKNIFSDEMRKRKRHLTEITDTAQAADVDLQKQLADADTALRILLFICVDRIWVGHSKLWKIKGMEGVPYLKPWKTVFTKRGLGTVAYFVIAFPVAWAVTAIAGLL